MRKIKIAPYRVFELIFWRVVGVWICIGILASFAAAAELIMLAPRP